MKQQICLARGTHSFNYKNHVVCYSTINFHLIPPSIFKIAFEEKEQMQWVSEAEKTNLVNIIFMFSLQQKY